MIKKAFNRRMLLRSAPAAALAAPTLAQEAAKNSAHIGYASAGIAPSSTSNADWIAAQKARFLDLINGKRDPERELYDRHSLDVVEAHRLDGMRSLSPTVRARLHVESTRRRRDEIEVEQAKISLAKIAKGMFY